MCVYQVNIDPVVDSNHIVFTSRTGLLTFRHLTIFYFNNLDQILITISLCGDGFSFDHLSIQFFICSCVILI